jgi:hypothetical protein
LQVNILGKQVLVVLVAFVVLGFAIYYFSSHAVVSLRVNVSHTTQMKVHWTDDTGQYSESKSTSLMIYKHKQHYLFVIDDISKIDRIRIFPATRGGVNVKLTEFRIFQEGYQEVNLFRNK